MNFIDRDEELNEIGFLLRTLNNGGAVQFPVREYVGIGGIGKSQLLKAICNECQIVNLPYVFIDANNFQSQNLAFWLWELLRVMCQELVTVVETAGKVSLSHMIKETLDDITTSQSGQNEGQLPPQSLIDQFLDALVDFGCVIVFDSVELIPSEVLEHIGQELIFPLSDSGHILVVLGTRTKINWGAPKYKIWRRTKSTLLEPFSSSETREQLSMTPFQELSMKIQSVTSGHPASNDVVIEILNYIENIEKRKVSREIFGDYEARLVDAVVDKVIRQRVVIPEHLFRAFYVFSILRRFDVDIPTELLMHINRSVDWNNTLLIMDLIRKMIGDTSYVVSLDSERNGYEINPFVRRTLSLHMRLFAREEYLEVSKDAFAYYDRKLTKSPTNIYLIVEKLYHLADIVRLSQPHKYDLNIATTLRTQLRQDLISSIGLPYEAIHRKNGGVAVTDDEERRRAFDRLRMALEQDQELHEKLGDIVDAQTSSFLVQALDEIQKDLLDTGKAVLDIVRHRSTDQVSNSEEYSIGFILSQNNVDITQTIAIPLRRKGRLLKDAREAQSVDELVDLGKIVRNQFLPSRIQEMLRVHKGPLTISVNDTTIPWELIHDGEEFTALKLPLGKRLRTAEDAKVGRLRSSSGIRPLLVGVPISDEPNFDPLPYVEEEITSLKNSLSSIDGLTFNPAQDVIFGEDADSYEFLKRLGSGRYDIIHFAGHAIHSVHGKTGLVLSDEIVSLDDIKRSVEGRPLVFLNACQSATDDIVEGKTGYVGSYTLGVASAFMLGGALACVGSIWKIVDSSSARFATNFYQELLSGVMIGEALRRTKVQTRMTNAQERTWASYILFGDPTVRLIIA